MAYKSGDIICFNRHVYINQSYSGRIYWQSHSALNQFTWGNYYTGTHPDVGSTLSHGSSMDIGVDSIEEAGVFVAPYNCRLRGIAYNILNSAKDTKATYFKIAVFQQEVTNGTARTDDATWKNVGEIQSTDREDETAYVVIKKSVVLDSSHGDVNAGDVLMLGVAGYGDASTDGHNLLRGVITVMLEVR